jgi:hypothetical protein
MMPRAKPRAIRLAEPVKKLIVVAPHTRGGGAVRLHIRRVKERLRNAST